MFLRNSFFRAFLVFFAAMAWGFTSHSQILNIDKSDTASYSQKTKANIAFNCGLEIDKQKKTLYDASNSAEILLQKNHELYIFSGSYRFTYSGSDDFLNAGYVHLRFRHNYKNKLEPEAYVQYQIDDTRGLMHRSLAGANYRYNFWKADKLELNTGLGMMYENEQWNYAGVDSFKIPPGATSVINRLMKLNSYIRLDWRANASSDLSVSCFVQSRFSSFHPRIAPSVQWNISAGKHVGMSVAFTSLYDEAPVVPINRFYYSFINSLFYKL